MKEEIIDIILSKINNSNEYRLSTDDCSSYDVSEYTKNFLFMEKELKLIRLEFERGETFIVTELGYKVIKNGGWVKHLELEKEKEEINHGKDKFDFLSKKWTYKSRLLPYLVSIISAIFSFYVFITNSTKHTEIQVMKKEIRLLQSKMKKQETLIPTNNYPKKHILKPE